MSTSGEPVTVAELVTRLAAEQLGRVSRERDRAWREEQERRDQLVRRGLLDYRNLRALRAWVRRGGE